MPQFLVYPTWNALKGPIFRKWTFKIAQWCLFLPWFLNPVSVFYLGLLSRKSFCKTKTIVLAKKTKIFSFASCEENTTNPYIFPVIQNTVSTTESESEYFLWVMQCKSSLTKYYNLSMKSVLLDITTKLDFLHCQAKQKKSTQENSMSNPSMPISAFNTNITIHNPFLATCFYWKTDHS